MHSIRVTVEKLGHGRLAVTIEPRKKGPHYFYALLFSVLVGVVRYESSKQEAKRKESVEVDDYSPPPTHPPDAEPLYEEFLQGDANRRLFPRPHLEMEFQEWTAGRGNSGRTGDP